MIEKTIFKKIIDGDLPAYKIYEDDKFLAFLNIYPTAPGYTVVIPKEEITWVWDVPYVGEYFELTRTLAQALRRAFDTDMIRCEIWGEEVPHAHIKIWPEIPCDGSEKEFEIIAEKIKQQIV